MKIGKIFASAGCGKTTALLEKLDEILQSGVLPNQVLFTTFTRAGAYEARDRAVTKYGYEPTQFPFFRTLHSICYRALAGPKLMSRRDYVQLGQQLGCYFGSAGLSDELQERGKGDAMLGLYNLQRNMCSDALLNPTDYGIHISKQEYEHFIQSYESYRNQFGLFDYTDLIETVVSEETPIPVRVGIVDEAQDITRLQFKAVQTLARNASVLWLAGDDDQAIYRFTGADPSILVGVKADTKIKRTVSYRLPPDLCDFATEFAKRIRGREYKTVTSHATLRERPRYRALIRGHTDVIQAIQSREKGSTTILCRNRVFCSSVLEQLHLGAIPYSPVEGYSLDQSIGYIKGGDILSAIRASRTWKLIYERQETCSGEDIRVLIGHIHRRFLRLKNRRQLLEDISEERKGARYTYRQLVETYGLLAQHSSEKVLDLPPSVISYIQSLEQKGLLDEDPWIKVGTIHSFKGKEDDHIILLPDMSWLTWRHYQKCPDDEHRVFFVGITRARKSLTIMQPISKYFYRF